MISVANNNFAPERHAMREALAAHGDCPLAFSALWHDFKRLHYRRPVGMGGPGAIPGVEIESYARLMRITHSRDDIEILFTLDALFLAAQSATASTEAMH